MIKGFVKKGQQEHSKLYVQLSGATYGPFLSESDADAALRLSSQLNEDIAGILVDNAGNEHYSANVLLEQLEGQIMFKLREGKQKGIPVDMLAPFALSVSHYNELFGVKDPLQFISGLIERALPGEADVLQKIMVELLGLSSVADWENMLRDAVYTILADMEQELPSEDINPQEVVEEGWDQWVKLMRAHKIDLSAEDRQRALKLKDELINEVNMGLESDQEMIGNAAESFLEKEIQPEPIERYVPVPKSVDIERERDRIMDLFNSGAISKDKFMEEMRKLSSKIKGFCKKGQFTGGFGGQSMVDQQTNFSIPNSEGPPGAQGDHGYDAERKKQLEKLRQQKLEEAKKKIQNKTK